MTSETPKETYGTRHLNGTFTSDSEILDILSEGPTNVIPFLITHPSSRATAWNAVAIKSFKTGFIPRIYLWLRLNPAMAQVAFKDPTFITSNVKGIFGKTGVHSWPLSHVNGRMLVCVSSSPRRGNSRRL